MWVCLKTEVPQLMAVIHEQLVFFFLGRNVGAKGTREALRIRRFHIIRVLVG